MELDLTNLSEKHCKLLTSISVEVQEDYIKILEELLNSTDKSISWLVSILFSRHTQQGELFISFVYIVFLGKVLKSDGVRKLVVPSKRFKIVIDKYKKDNNLDLTITVSESGRENTSIFKYQLQMLFKSLCFVIALLKSKNRNRIRSIKKNHKITLIDTFFLEDTIKSEKYIDRYFSGLLDRIPEEKKERVFFTPTILGEFNKKILDNIVNNSRENIMYKHDFLSLSDYLYCFYLIFKSRRISRNISFYRGFDLFPLIDYEIEKYRYSYSSFYGLINYLFVKRLKKAKIKVDLVIDWFENQPIDKGFVRGFREFYPKTYIKGYQGFLVSTDFHFYLLPTDYENKLKVIPHEIVVVGKKLSERVKRFAPNLKVRVGPAFRFHLNPSVAHKQISQRKVILLILPIGLEDSTDVIKKFAEGMTSIQNDLKIEVHIKPHPVDSVDKIKFLAKTYLESTHTIVSGSFIDCIMSATLVVGAASSSLMEALTYGVPVIVLGKTNGISQNPIPRDVDNRIWDICYSPKEIAVKIVHYLNLTVDEKSDIKEVGNIVKRDYFEPISLKGVLELLSI